MLRYLGRALLDWVYPPGIYCLCCGRPLDRRTPYSLCRHCFARLNWANRNVCTVCGRPAERTGERVLCHDCAASPKPFRAGAVCVGYGTAERGMLLRFKYAGESYMGEELGKLMAERIQAEQWPIELVVPVPLHRTKWHRRGYNQAELLARAIARELSLPCLPDGLIRTVATTPMSRLTGLARRQSLRGVFRVDSKRATELIGRNILVVDDIYTTGSTVSECAETLRKAGAAAVYVAAFAAAADIRSQIAAGTCVPVG